jgi:hypothetical protein
MELGRVKVKSLEEASGIVASRRNADIIWVHTDGEAKRLYGVTTTGRVAAQVKIPEEVKDLEDIALGPGPEEGVDYLYLGDIGDNDGDRRDVRVFRFPEPVLQDDPQPKVKQVEEFHLRYPDGPYDAEALMVDPVSGDLVIATKEQKGSRLFVAPSGSLRDGRAIELPLLARVDTDRVSAGDISSDGSRLALRREDRGWLWERLPGESLATALEREPLKIEVHGRRQGQNGESIAFTPDGSGYYTLSEGKNERLYLFKLPR